MTVDGTTSLQVVRVDGDEPEFDTGMVIDGDVSLPDAPIEPSVTESGINSVPSADVRELTPSLPGKISLETAKNLDKELNSQVQRASSPIGNVDVPPLIPKSLRQTPLSIM